MVNKIDFVRSDYIEIVRPTVCQKLYKLFEALICCIPVVGWGLIWAKNHTDRMRTAKLTDHLARSRLEAMGKYAGEDTISKKILASLKSGENLPAQTKKIQKMMTQAMNDPNTSAELKGRVSNFAYAMRVEASGLEALREYGRQIGAPIETQENYSLKEVGEALVATFNQMPAARQDSFTYGVIWSITHPGNLIKHLQASGKIADPVNTYNPYAQGNVTMAGWSYTLKDKTIPFYFGPGPGAKSDRSFDAYMEKMKGEGRVHLQHCLEHPSVAGEKERREVIGQFQKDYPGHFRLYATPQNGPAWKMEEEFLNWNEPGEFIQKYKEFACQGFRNLDNLTGFYVGNDVMTDEQFKRAFDRAKAIAQLQNAYRADKKTIGKGLQVLTQALISLQALENLTQENEPVFAQACKEDIDRGVVSNISLRLLIMAKNGEPITQEVLEDLIGTCFGRADLVSQKRIVQDKFEALLAFTYILSGLDSEQLTKIF